MFKKLRKSKKENQGDLKITVIDDNKELPDVRKIPIPDLKQYIVNGYNEIREEKAKNLELKEKLDIANNYKHLYESTLVALDEFKKRDDENKTVISNFEETIEKKKQKINELEDVINEYKIKEEEVIKKENSISLLVKEKERNARKEYKQKVMSEIKNIKGNISKSKLLNIIENLKE